VNGKRRLPLLQPSAGAGDGEPKRPPWQWAGFGAVLIFTAWLPLTAVAVAVARALGARTEGGHVAWLGAAVVAMYGVAIALGSFGGGFVLGRWGDDGVGVREAALAGLAAGLGAVAGAWFLSGFSPGALVVAALAASGAAAGGSRGLRARARLP
jgi:hypothetical protein